MRPSTQGTHNSPFAGPGSPDPLLAFPASDVLELTAPPARSDPGERLRWFVEQLLTIALCTLASPLMLLAVALVRISSRGPIFHRRLVLGQYGTPFYALKFRTMVVDADHRLREDAALREQFEVSFKLSNDPRVTSTGQFLRRYSLDELPQLFNVLRGEMALIGPRMISPPELVRYGMQAERLLSVKPGLTGLWQVSGRQTTSYDERVQLDMHYVQHRSLWLDLQILAKTLPAVLRARGAY
jgi:lipopolysaccharide/colanic/teichoic acid biosynthesis glycosyltransferase